MMNWQGSHACGQNDKKKNIRRTCTLCTNKDFSSQWKEMLSFLSNSMPGEGGGENLRFQVTGKI